jgi:hypothetical protein
VLKVADLAKAFPTKWEAMAENTVMRRAWALTLRLLYTAVKDRPHPKAAVQRTRRLRSSSPLDNAWEYALTLNIITLVLTSVPSLVGTFFGK